MSTNRYDQVKERVLTGSDMDYFGICPSSVLEGEPEGHRPSDLLPNAKSIIVYGRKLINGTIQAKFRAIEDGRSNTAGSYNAHSFVLSLNHLCMKQTYEIAQYLEKNFGCYAMPLTNNVIQAVEPEGLPAPFFADPYRAGLPIDIYKAAVAAGIGELGWNHRVITPDNGPRVYMCAIVTSLEFDKYDSPYSGKKLCDPEKCHVCSGKCPVHALDAEEFTEVTVAGKTYRLGKLDVNGCGVACFGFRKALNPRTKVEVAEDHPTDEALAKAIDFNYKHPAGQTLDHLSMSNCDWCLLYCPVGNWEKTFKDRGLTKG